jgi:hypothetical protein
MYNYTIFQIVLHLEQGLLNFFCKESDSQYSRLQAIWSLLQLLNSAQPQTIYKEMSVAMSK